MFSIDGELNRELPDVTAFVDRINEAAASVFFDERREIFLSRAPGRLDLMGGIADYSGSLVLQYPLQEATLVAFQRDASPLIKIKSFISAGGENESALAFEIAPDELKSGGKLRDYATAREYFRQQPAQQWAAYIIGVLIVLMNERGINFTEGGRILISSNVPEGKGVSSSAALEVAVMQAVNAAFNLQLPPRDLALLCQKVENEIVGAPCGVMDQMVSAVGEADKLLALICQPAELQTPLELPAEIKIWGIDSGIKHSVAGADYGSVRAGASIGYRMIAAIAGLKVENLANNFVCIEDTKWRGYLANLTPEEFAANFAAELPLRIKGGDFLHRFHGTTDRISVIQPEKEYAVRIPTAHPIYENFRVQEFARILGEKINAGQLQSLGKLMYQSHASYSACGLGADATDLLVSLVKKSGAENGLYGAKITGGGSGGTVAVLGLKTAEKALNEVVESFARQTGYEPLIFAGSSAGACKFGFRRLQNKHLKGFNI